MELELCKRLKKLADEDKTLDQYGIRKFAEAFDVVPRTLAENSGECVFGTGVAVSWAGGWAPIKCLHVAPSS